MESSMPIGQWMFQFQMPILKSYSKDHSRHQLDTDTETKIYMHKAYGEVLLGITTVGKKKKRE